jgi:hypothetical protein
METVSSYGRRITYIYIYKIVNLNLEGPKTTFEFVTNPEKLGQILLNGNNVCMVILGVERFSDCVDDSWWRGTV